MTFLFRRMLNKLKRLEPIHSRKPRSTFRKRTRTILGEQLESRSLLASFPCQTLDLSPHHDHSATVDVCLTDDELESLSASRSSLTGAILPEAADDGTPKVTNITRRDPTSNRTNADQVTFRVVFSEAVRSATVNVTDFALSGTAAADGTVSSVTAANGTTYDVLITGLTNSNGVINLDIATGATILDNTGVALRDPVPTGFDFGYFLDNTAPRVVSVARQVPTSNRTNADEVTFRVTFNEDVAGVELADFALSGTAAVDGTIAEVLSIVDSGSEFDVRVTGLAESSGLLNLDLSAAFAISDLAANPLTDTVALKGDSPFFLDNLPPRVQTIGRLAPVENRTSADEVTFRVTFVEDVTGVDASDFVVAGLAATSGTIADVTSFSASEYDVRVTGLANSNGPLGLELAPIFEIADLATNPLTNPATALPPQFYTLDNLMPRLTTIMRIDPVANRTNADAVVFRLTFGEDVTGVDTADFVLSGTAAAEGSIAEVVSVSPAEYDLRVTGLTNSNGPVSLDLATGYSVVDLAGNPLAEPGEGMINQVYVLDNNSPRLMGISRHLPTAIRTSADEVLFRATFNEDVTDVDVTDFVASGIAAPDGSIVEVTQISATEYDLRVSGLATSNGPIGVELAASFSILDLAANPIVDPASVVPSQFYTIDNLAPRLINIVRQSPGASRTNADEVIFRATFNEDVTGVDVSDFATSGLIAADGTIADVTAVSGTEYDVRVVGLSASNGPILLELAASSSIVDLAANAILDPMSVQPSQPFTIDNLAPRLESIVRLSPESIPTNADEIVFRAVFTEDVTNVDAADFVLSGSGAAGGEIRVSAISPAEYDVAVSGLTNGNGVVNLDLAENLTVSDMASNALAFGGVVNSEQIFILDNTAPRLASITLQDPIANVINSDEVMFRVVFDEDVSGVESSDFTLNGAAAAEGVILRTTPISPTTYDVLVAGIANSNGSLGLELVSGFAISDLAGNFIVDSAATLASETYLLDNIPPVFIPEPSSHEIEGPPKVSYFAHDAGGIAGDAQVFWDVDLNNDGDFADPSETGYGQGTTTNGKATFDTATTELAEGIFGVRMRAIDTAGNEGMSDTTIVVLDMTAPTIRETTMLSPSGSYRSGAVLDFSVTFTENVNVSGTPLLELETGGADHVATYVNGSGSDTLTFRYKIQPGDAAGDLDYTSAAALNANGGTIQDATGIDALLSLPPPGSAGSLSGNSDVIIDTTPPIVTVTVMATTNKTPTLTGTVSDPTPGSGPAAVSVVIAGQTLAATVVGNSWSVAVPSPLDDNRFDIEATASDVAGNSSVDNTLSELIVDSVLPVITVTGQITGDTTPTLSGTVNDPPPVSGVTGVTVVVGGQTLEASIRDGMWSVEVPSSLPNGAYDVVATAYHAEGNHSSDTSADELIIDTTAPRVTVTAVVSADNRPVLTGTVEDFAAVRGVSSVAVEVNDFALPVTVVGNTWTATMPESLVDGTYDVQAKAIDSVGNVGFDATLEELIIDTAAPSVSVSDQITSIATPTLGGTVTDPSPSSGIHTVWVSIDGQTIAATIQGSTWVAPISSPISDGTHDIVVTVADSAGNAQSDATNHELIVDTVAPVIGVAELVTLDNTPTLRGTISDISPSSGITGVSVVVAGQTLSAAVTGNEWSVEVPLALSDGIFDVQAVAVDVAGNSASDASSDELIVDTKQPIVTVSQLVTNDSTPIVRGTVSDPGFGNGSSGSGVHRVTVTVAGQTLDPSVDGTEWSVFIPAALAEGTFDVQVEVTDAAGNTAQDSTENEVVVDTIRPAITVTELLTANNRPTIFGTVIDPSPGSGVPTVTVTVAQQTMTAIVDGVIWGIIVPSALVDGIVDVQVAATDIAGNNSVDPTVGELLVDVTAPSATIDSFSTLDDTPVLTGKVTDGAIGSGISSVTVLVGDQSLTASLSGDSWRANVTNPLPDGTYDVQVIVVDTAGNIGGDESSDEVIIATDKLPPVVTVVALKTNHDMPVLEGTVSDVAPTSLVTGVTVIVADQVLTATVEGDHWTVAVPVEIADGTYDVQVTAVDGAGHVGSDTTTDELAVYEWQQTQQSRDVDGDGAITPLDALAVINELKYRVHSDPETGELENRTDPALPFYDVNGDGRCTISDVLWVINRLNENGAAGEPAVVEVIPETHDVQDEPDSQDEPAIPEPTTNPIVPTPAPANTEQDLVDNGVAYFVPLPPGYEWPRAATTLASANSCESPSPTSDFETSLLQQCDELEETLNEIAGDVFDAGHRTDL